MFQTLNTFDTEFSADSVEWCPAEPFKDLFVCGTYQLSESKDNEICETNTSTKRLGRIYMFRAFKAEQLKLLQRIEVPGVLDMKWVHIVYRGKILLGVVNSIGCLQIYELKVQDQEKLDLVVETKVNDYEKEALALSLDWCSGRWSNNDNANLQIVVTDSKGWISLFKMHDKELEKLGTWHAHEFEAWIGAFDYWDINVIYTGGDDCKFKRIDTRMDNVPLFSNTIHGAGVTSIHSNIDREHLLSTGSYDEILRLWDTRNLKRSLSETNLHGGIWRLKWDPFVRRYLLAACMYGGFRIIDCKNSELPTIVGDYNEHESISYGCDWCLLTRKEILERNILQLDKQNSILIATCSFYDHVLKLSAVNITDVLTN